MIADRDDAKVVLGQVVNQLSRNPSAIARSRVEMKIDPIDRRYFGSRLRHCYSQSRFNRFVDGRKPAQPSINRAVRFGAQAPTESIRSIEIRALAAISGSTVTG
jgi:hypothetical protein